MNIYQEYDDHAGDKANGHRTKCSFKQNGFVMNSPFIVNALLSNDNGNANDAVRRNYAYANGTAKASIRPAAQKYPQHSYLHGNTARTAASAMPAPPATVVIPSNTAQHEDDLSNIDVKSLVSFFFCDRFIGTYSNKSSKPKEF